MTNEARRDFIKGGAAGIGLGMLASMGIFSYSPAKSIFLPKESRKQIDFGTIKSVEITNISETSWFDNSVLMGDMKGAGGLLVDQYLFNWPPFGNGKGLAKGSYEEGIAQIKHLLPHDVDKAWEITKELSVHPENPGGYSALLDIERLDGSKKKYLLDCGWSYEWMHKSFKREGIDKMLENGEIDTLILTHEHFDHFWGLPVVLKYKPDIKIIIHEGFYPEGRKYINDSGHTGELVVFKKGRNILEPGMCVYCYDCPIISRVFGEQSVFVNIKDKGLVSITGCCHQGIVTFSDSAYKELKYDNDQMHGLYGGLHISPFEDWDPKYDDLVIGLRNWDYKVMACNHCTGLLTVQKFVREGYPIVRGTARYRSKTKDYLGNGDKIKFG